MTALEEQKAALIEIAKAPAVVPMPARHRESDRFIRPDPAGNRPDQALRRPGRQQRHRFHGEPWRAARRDRPEWRRQDDLLQDADLRGAADIGQDRVRGPRHHRHERDRRVPARPDQELSGQPAVHAAHGARKLDDCGARGTARKIPPRHAAAAVENSGARPSRSSARSSSSISPGAPTRRCRRSPMARSGVWKSALRLRPRRASFCSTSRSPA